MTIGVTGGIGSGKTTVCRLFEMLGIPVYYADKEEQVRGRINSQLPESEKVNVADFVIDNGGGKSLVRQIWKIHQALIAFPEG